MRRLITFGVFVCVLGSTHGGRFVKLLTQEEIVPILVDLEVAKAMASHYAEDEETAHETFKRNALLIYQAHGTDPGAFQRSCQYYLNHIEMMREIYDLVVKCLEDLEGQI